MGTPIEGVPVISEQDIEEFSAAREGEPERCIININESLPPGKACNAAAVVAFTLGQRHSRLVGQPLIEAGGATHPGLIPVGIPILRAPAAKLASLRGKALGQCDVVDFPRQGQETTDYQAFRQAVLAATTDSLDYLAVGLVGSKKSLGKLTGGLALFT
jgi:hypothetical protein